MYPSSTTPLSITEARAARVGRRMLKASVAQGSERPLDKRGVAGSRPATCTITLGTSAGGCTPATGHSCGGSSTVERRSAKSKAAGSSPVPRSQYGRVPTVITVRSRLSAGVAQLVERRPSKSDVAGSSPVSRSVTARPLNRPAGSCIRRLCAWGFSSVVEQRPVSSLVEGSIPSGPAMNTYTLHESWRTSSDRTPYRGRSGDGTGLQNQSAGFDSLAPCQSQQQ